MSQVAAVQLKDNWSISCNGAAQYEGMKTLLQKLGYTFAQGDEYEAGYSTVCSSDEREGGVTQGYNYYTSYTHFDNIMDFLVFHLGAESDVAVQIELRRAQIATIEQEIHALAVAA